MYKVNSEGQYSYKFDLVINHFNRVTFIVSFLMVLKIVGYRCVRGRGVERQSRILIYVYMYNVT